MAFRMNRRRLRAALILNTSGRGATGRVRPVKDQNGGMWVVGKRSEGPEPKVGPQPGWAGQREWGKTTERMDG